MDSLGNLVQECLIILGFTVARAGADGGGDNWNCETCTNHLH